MDKEHLPAVPSPGGRFLIYRDGATHLQVRLDGQTVWLTQAAMGELFQTTVPNINIHIRNILEEGELGQESVVKEYLITAAEDTRWLNFYD